MKKKILFMCYKNSFRSQICEAWAKSLKGDVFEAHSAGAEPAPALNTRGLETMRQLGVDMAGQSPRALAAYADTAFDYVVTVCAPDAECPIYTGLGKKVHWIVPNPPGFKSGDPEAYKEVCLAFKKLIQEMPESLH